MDADRADRRVIAFYASARSLQIGEGVEVIALTSVAANLAAILGGILVFTTRSAPALEIGARFLAFCLVIAGAALMPAPMRATSRRGRDRPTTARRITTSAGEHLTEFGRDRLRCLCEMTGCGSFYVR